MKKIIISTENQVMLDGLLTLGLLENGLHTADFMCCENVEIDSFSGLLIDYAREKNCHIAIRGLRAITDFDYEIHFAQTNFTISKGDLETVFLTTGLEYAFLSSSTVREIASFHGDVSELVPKYVARKLYQRFGFDD